MNQPTTPGSTQSKRSQVSPFARARRKRDIDELMDRYVSWREACAAVTAAYQIWQAAERANRELTFTIYCLALDREERAAETYQIAVARVAAA